MIFPKLYSFKKKILKQNLFVLLIAIAVLIVFVRIVGAIDVNWENFILINDIYPGMKGVGKTVFTGTKIEEFEVEVIDIIRDSESSSPYILVALSGDKIENNGGISAGMSGSPVFFGGKLSGAISHAWEMSEHNLCLITPIMSMISLFDYIHEGRESTNIFKDSDEKIVSVYLDENLRNKLIGLNLNKNTFDSCIAENVVDIIYFDYIQSPLLIEALSYRANKYIKSGFEKNGISDIASLPGHKGINNELKISTDAKHLYPGSAIGVQLSTGDINIIGIGTATYINNNYVLALGHPFLHRGNVSYLFSSVYIYHSFPSIVMPFKIGTPYLLIGEVVQDRNEGILAKTNTFPSIMSCRVYVHDLEHNKDIVSGVKVIPEKEFVQSVVPALLIQSVDNAINRIGQGNGLVKFNFRNAVSGEILSYENLFFSENDIAFEISKDLNYLFEVIYNNFHEKIDLNEIVIEASINKDNNKAVIQEVNVDIADYFPGDNIEVNIIISPFRQSDKKEVINIRLPENIKNGTAMIVVRGGSTEKETNDVAENNKGLTYLKGWSEIDSFLSKQDRNFQVIAEIIPININENLSQPDTNGLENFDDDYRIILNTDYVIEGYHEIFINILQNQNNEME